MTDKNNIYYEKLQKNINKDKKKYTKREPKFTKTGSCIIGIIGCIIAVLLEFNSTANASDAFSFTVPAMIALIGMEFALGIWSKHTKYLTNQNEIKCGATLGLLGFILISFIYMFVKFLPEGGVGTSFTFAFTFAIVPYFIPLIIYFVKFFPPYIPSEGSVNTNSTNTREEKKPTFSFGTSYIKDEIGNIKGSAITTTYSDKYGDIETTEYRDNLGHITGRKDTYR